MPGSGKTTLGKKLATALEYTFTDLDEQVVIAAGMSIADLFATQGEATFRQTESQVLRETATLKNAVVSTGGGVPCFFDNMDFINAHGLSLWLDLPIALLASRIAESNTVRPMFAGKTLPEMMQLLEEKARERLPFYSRAALHLSAEELLLPELLKKISLV